MNLRIVVSRMPVPQGIPRRRVLKSRILKQRVSANRIGPSQTGLKRGRSQITRNQVIRHRNTDLHRPSISLRQITKRRPKSLRPNTERLIHRFDQGRRHSRNSGGQERNPTHSCSPYLFRDKNADGNQVAHPARRPLFARRYELERPVVGDRLAVFAIRHQHCCVVHIGSNFGQ